MSRKQKDWLSAMYLFALFANLLQGVSGSLVRCVRMIPLGWGGKARPPVSMGCRCFAVLLIGTGVFLGLTFSASAQTPAFSYSVPFNPFDTLSSAGKFAEASVQSSDPGNILVFYTTGEILPGSDPPFGGDESIRITRPVAYRKASEVAYNGDGTILVELRSVDGSNVVTGMAIGLISNGEINVISSGDWLDPNDMNEAGTICGRANFTRGHPAGTHPNGTSVPVLISPAGAVSEIPYPGGEPWGYDFLDRRDNEGRAVAINASGTVVCTATRYKHIASFEEFSFVSRNGETLAPDLPSGATDINDRGEVVGADGKSIWIYLPSGGHGLGQGVHYLFTDHSYGAPRPLISNSGLVAITDLFPDRPLKVWKNGTLYDLPSLVSIADNEFEIEIIRDMNDLGQINVRTRETAISPNFLGSRILTPEEPTAEVNSVDDDPISGSATGAETGEFLPDGTPEVTLRSAIEAANLGKVGRIIFDIPADGLPANGIPVIQPQSNLPAVNAQVPIDGTTQAGGWVEVRGSGTLDHGIKIVGGNCELRGFILNRFSKTGGSTVLLSGGGDNKVVGNRIGVDADGETTQQDSGGITIEGSSGNTIGGTTVEDRNILYGYDGCVLIKGTGADNNVIVGNYVNMVASGTSADSGVGITLLEGNGNRIGGAEAGEGNLIGADDGIGIFCFPDGPVDGLEIVGNRIGLDAAGTATTGDGLLGIAIIGTVSHSPTSVELRNNFVAGFRTEIWCKNFPAPIVDGNEVGFAFDASGNFPAGVDPAVLRHGIRLELCPGAEVTNNKVAGHEYDIAVSGRVASNLNVGTGTVSPDFVEYPAAAEPYEDVVAENLLIEGNEVGTYEAVVPPNSQQKYGIVVFGNQGQAQIIGNTVVGHGEKEIALFSGIEHVVKGNDVGVIEGVGYGSKRGIEIAFAHDVEVGTISEPNRIGFIDGEAIVILGDADRAVIRGNKIGVPVGFGDPQPCNRGIYVVGDQSGTPDDLLIIGNEIGGATGAGIFLITAGETEISENRIGVARNGAVLPNLIGIAVHQTPVVIHNNTIAENTQDGILIGEVQQDSKVEISGNSIYGNGDAGNPNQLGIRYHATNPFPNVGVVTVASIHPNDGAFLFYFIVLPLGIDETAELEVFGNDSDDNAQGQYPLVRKSFFGGAPGVVKFEAPIDGIAEFAQNLRFTVTAGGLTSQFFSETSIIPFEFPKLEVEDYDSDTITLKWNGAFLFVPQVKFDLDGEWMDIQEPVTQDGDTEKVTYPFDPNEQSHFFQLRVNALRILNEI